MSKQMTEQELQFVQARAQMRREYPHIRVVADGDCDELLAHIDALTAERDNWKEDARQMTENRDFYQAERDRLRVALTQAKKALGGYLGNKDVTAIFLQAMEARGIVESALSGGEGEKG